jgi:hypothetical protein
MGPMRTSLHDPEFISGPIQAYFSPSVGNMCGTDFLKLDTRGDRQKKMLNSAPIFQTTSSCSQASVTRLQGERIFTSWVSIYFESFFGKL